MSELICCSRNVNQGLRVGPVESQVSSTFEYSLNSRHKMSRVTRLVQPT